MAARLRFVILLSVAAALVTLVLKFAAYLLTDSVGLLSDALESLVNLAAALTAYFSLWYAARPADSSHAYGHEKIEFFSSGLEGMLILVAAGGIVWTAIPRFYKDVELQSLGAGTLIAFAASMVNLVVAVILLRVGRKAGSIVLEADGQHLMTDVWTSFGVLAAIGLVALTGWKILDPLVAILVAAHITWTGFGLVRRSFDGLMDRAWPENEREELRRLIREQLPPGTDFHALRTRRAGGRRFADLHLLVPGSMSVSDAHALAHRVEAGVEAGRPGLDLTIHVEPIEDSASWGDSEAARLEGAIRATEVQP
jgi:cation diffusion facilitator family transporter